MASAVLASRNEAHWGEHKVYMRKYSNNPTSSPNLLSRFNPNPNFLSKAKVNPNPSTQVHDPPTRRSSYVWQNQEPSPRAGALAFSDDACLSHRNSVADENNGEYAHCGYATFDLSNLSKGEQKQLKRRLISELELVRRLRNWVETKDFVPRPPELVTDSRSSVAVTSRDNDRNIRTFEHAPDMKKTLDPKFKSKKVTNKKRVLPFPFSGRDAKRPVVLSNSPFDKVMKSCKRILSSLMKHKFGWVFNDPVDVVRLGLNDYHKVIKHPMDLGTVKSRLDNNEYRSPLDFASDVRLTFNNAMTYNPRGQDAHVMADALLAIFEKSFKSSYQKYKIEHQKLGGLGQVDRKSGNSLASPIVLSDMLAEPEAIMVAKKSHSPRMSPTLLNTSLTQVQNSTRPLPIPASSPRTVTPPLLSPKGVQLLPSFPKPVAVPKSAKLPKPKAKDTNKRQMTLEEKARLGESLQQIPEVKMELLVQLVRKRNPHLMQEGDEIELDLDTIDTETLWDLDRFVVYHKKTMSKKMRQGLLNNLQENVKKSPVSEVGMQKSKKGDFAEEDVDIGGESPIKYFPPMEIEKDTACASDNSSSSSGSSSSSDSSSSSGGRDSGSSSGSDSDDSVQSPCVDPKVDDPIGVPVS